MAKAVKTTTGVTKFQKIVALTGKDLLEQRARIIFKQTRDAMQDHVTNLERRRETLELDLLNLTDLAVETNDSLRPGSKNFKADQWVNAICELKREMQIIEEHLEIAQSVQNEYFEEVEA